MKYLALTIALLCATLALAVPPANFDERVESLRNSLGAPGVSIAIVENGRTTLAKGYGIRKLGQPERVGPDTIFQTGSTGKAFTVAALASIDPLRQPPAELEVVEEIAGDCTKKRQGLQKIRFPGSVW